MPSPQISKKKLKAIVFTDIVDFTKISAQDEQFALDIIDKQRIILKPIVNEHKGEWLKEIGDGLLFSFDSSLDAVRCSINIQEALKPVSEFKIRIGIHQGDIFIKDSDVYGDDVNIASRVEGFSPVGGISISDKVYKDIQGVKDIKTSFIGHKPLKGVSQETKVRCITSNNLPENRGNIVPKIIGFSNMYFGSLLLMLFSVMGLFFLFDIGNINIKALDKNEVIPVVLFINLNLGLNLILFGYSTISFQRGVSIKSQKIIYYIGFIYIFVLLIFLGNNLKMITLDGEESSLFYSLGGWALTALLYLLPLIIFKSINFLYKRIFNK